MGREVKRVPVDWDWPVEEIWEGYINPLGGFPPCPDCSYEEAPTLIDQMFPQTNRPGTGLTPEAYAISQTFYGHQIESAVGSRFGYGPNPGAKRLAWGDKIGQAEVDNLVKEGRLRKWVDGKWESVPRTAAEVNAENRVGGIGGHDGINRWILIRFRCETLGIEHDCPTCKGHGNIATEEQREAYENWERIEPPTGEGWQVWETVSEGSPITPVFPTAEALIDYLAADGTAWDQKPDRFDGGKVPGGWRREAAEAFVKSGWAPSLVTNRDSSGTTVLEGGRDADLMEASKSKDG